MNKVSFNNHQSTEFKTFVQDIRLSIMEYFDEKELDGGDDVDAHVDSFELDDIGQDLVEMIPDDEKDVWNNFIYETLSEISDKVKDDLENSEDEEED